MFGRHLLNTRPGFVQGEPVQTQHATRFYEGILKSHPDCVYVKARLAVSYNHLGATGSAIELGQEVQAQLADVDIQDSVFDSIVDEWEATLQAEAAEALAADMSAPTSEPWKPTKDRPFPTHLLIPSGYEALKSKWQCCEQFRSRLLIANAIQTNHIEHTFLLTVLRKI
ncbi:hypothetical protein C8R45DRAFT_490494 [Mycena sanguinolenta]|nr:hypothetical protein C8R45DRAFT_490494 [Mycena sanguinolenta]